MAELPGLVGDLALILVVAAGVTLLFKKLRQPLVLGYIVAGFLVGPHMPHTMGVADKAGVHTWADIGVMFLLFSLGLEFSFKKILRMGFAPVVAALTIVSSMMLTGLAVGWAFGWGPMDRLFLAGMLAMSSTTIIYKAFDDLGLRQQRFASLVMGVLILEDILAIVMMVVLAAVAAGGGASGGVMAGSLLKIGFFVVLWFVVGIFTVPLFLRSARRLMNEETMLIVAVGLCCLMAAVSSAAGFSSAFGAFVMGSILAETVEADKIAHLVEPVKNLFGAVFFVSVGMLVDPAVLAGYALPIAAIVAAILVGQGVFGTAGFMLSGQPLKTAMQCGFSMAQVGEFAFIIASLGLSLGVVGDFLYPVVVAVSVITTFLTPYMMKWAVPCYSALERRLPRRWARSLGHLGQAHVSSPRERGDWRVLIGSMAANTAVYSILSAAATALMLSFFLPFCRGVLPAGWAEGVCGLATAALIAPFLRAMVVKKNHSREFKALWTAGRLNRLPLVFTVVARVAVASAFVFYICNRLAHFAGALALSVAVAAVTLMVMSRRIKKRSIALERLFIQNLRSREAAERARGGRRPKYERSLLDWDIHMGDFDVPEDSAWAGRTLSQLRFGSRFGVHVSSILRGGRRTNIPGGHSVVFPGDRLRAIGDDEQLKEFGRALKEAVLPEDTEIEKRDMDLRRVVVGEGSPVAGKTLAASGIRERYGCMVVGVEEGSEKTTMIDPSREFLPGDAIWVVGENGPLDRIERELS